MYLKKLEVRGFKSFASKTTFEFEPGITAVVGPNGSGKSNVVDALAWVMGEQGVKNLRGGKMEDVIFAGTSGRQALGRAQVTLTIDNSDGALPIEYSEVAISRTLFRAGGSEYQINGSPARLLDIQELLSDSGLGREMHVIVGQGQLDRIFHATPEERRGFIEEAAGILKHRRRKERSVRKLDAMRGNLDRVRDLTEEVRRQLGPLSRQADTARKAQRIQYDVRDARARLLADDVEQQLRVVADLVEQDRGHDEELSVAKQNIALVSEQIASLDQELDDIMQAATVAREHRYGLSGLQERYRSLLSVTDERLRTASAPIMKTSTVTSEQAQTQLDQATEEYQQICETKAKTEQALARATQEKDEAERAARIVAQAYTDALQEEAQRHRAIASAEAKLATATAELEALKAQWTHVSDETGYRQNTIQELENKLSGYHTQAEEAGQQRAEMEGQLQEADQKLSQKRAEFDELTGHLTAQNREYSAIQARIEVLKDSLEPEKGSARASLKNVAVAELSAQFVVSTGWERAIAAVLPMSVEQLWADDSQTVKVAVELLQQAEVETTRIYSPSAHRESDSTGHQLPEGLSAAVDHVSVRESRVGSAVTATLHELFGHVVLCEDLEDAARAMQRLDEAGLNSGDFLIATRAGHLVTSLWVQVHGAGGTSHVEARGSLDDAEKTANRLKAEISTQQQRAEQLREAVRACEQARNEIRERTDEARRGETTYRERMAATKTSLAQTVQNSKRSEQQLEELADRIQTAQDRLAGYQEAYDTAVAAEQVAAQQHTSEDSPSEQEAERAEARAVEARRAETEVRLALRTQEASEQQAQHRVEQSRRRLSAAHLAEQEFSRALHQQRHRVSHLEQVHVAVTAVLEKIGSSVRRAENDEQEFVATREQTQQRREALVHRRQQAQSDLEKLKERTHARQLARQEQEIKLEQLKQKSLDTLGYTHDYLVANFGTDQPIPEFNEGQQDQDEAVSSTAYRRDEQEKRLKKAERELRALGKVNPLALEEYSAVQERHQYLSEQLEDLENSRRDLLQIIEDVDATVLRVFREAFEDTSAQFEHVFSTLFPGGEGALVLTDPENMLETGIEVHARPAGKKVTRLSLLSGGERSLAAVALLVSIFKARPSPFYVMDEVEAALDDANLSRLLTIFKELQRDSQLIIITHQQRTMNIADALYGVSMRGDGVSQVISQRLSHDET
ncbi:chromosome segregation protein SMC [Auritidibacter ignavus]|uniref:Chromosome partition protein Smc n=1 Tax=Auritidibacter ignavus TaxID=678932 RepID=A0AAJ6AHN0_9MICC|nr:chromosome segregation protein SMC [Auritidibacter ignavus]WGH93455.1 chromosome segregation protein SMC [Auritidibacter ignavus]